MDLLNFPDHIQNVHMEMFRPVDEVEVEKGVVPLSRFSVIDGDETFGFDLPVDADSRKTLLLMGEGLQVTWPDFFLSLTPEEVSSYDTSSDEWEETWQTILRAMQVRRTNGMTAKVTGVVTEEVRAVN